MGILISPQAEIESIRFVPFRSQAKKAEKVICIGNTIMARLDAGTCATNRVRSQFAYLPGHYGMDSVVTGLFRLGMISKEVMDAHLALCEEKRRKSDCKHAAEDIMSGAKKLGVTLTRAQLRKIKAVQP